MEGEGKTGKRAREGKEKQGKVAWQDSPICRLRSGWVRKEEGKGKERRLRRHGKVREGKALDRKKV